VSSHASSTDKGFVKFTVSNYEVHQIGINMASDLVFSLALSRNNHIWLATSKSGLIRYDPRKKQYDKKSRMLFVGRSERDLRCYELRSDTLLPLYDRLPKHNILSIVTDKNLPHVLWIGTDNGLVKFDIKARQSVRIFSIRDGLPDRVVYCTVMDNSGVSIPAI
jgi:ligand-binding sensor domain-containing protein